MNKIKPDEVRSSLIITSFAVIPRTFNIQGALNDFPEPKELRFNLTLVIYLGLP